MDWSTLIASQVDTSHSPPALAMGFAELHGESVPAPLLNPGPPAHEQYLRTVASNLVVIGCREVGGGRHQASPSSEWTRWAVAAQSATSASSAESKSTETVTPVGRKPNCKPPRAARLRHRSLGSRVSGSGRRTDTCHRYWERTAQNGPMNLRNLNLCVASPFGHLSRRRTETRNVVRKAGLQLRGRWSLTQL